jgi:hypothetical protein
MGAKKTTLHKKNFSLDFFLLKLELLSNNFFSKISKWRINQNVDFFYNFFRCSDFISILFMSNQRSMNWEFFEKELDRSL